jgi:hypothetical protein
VSFLLFPAPVVYGPGHPSTTAPPARASQSNWHKPRTPLPGTKMTRSQKKAEALREFDKNRVMVSSTLPPDHAPQPRAHLWQLDCRVPVGFRGSV